MPFLSHLSVHPIFFENCSTWSCLLKLGQQRWMLQLVRSFCQNQSVFVPMTLDARSITSAPVYSTVVNCFAPYNIFAHQVNDVYVVNESSFHRTSEVRSCKIGKWSVNCATLSLCTSNNMGSCTRCDRSCSTVNKLHESIQNILFQQMNDSSVC
jgi:hypothetical protein